MAMCPSEHEAGIKLELKKLQFSHKGPSSKTYPYPEGEDNGAVGPKYASVIKFFLTIHNFT